MATAWWTEAPRGGKPVPATQEQLSKMLTTDDVAAAAMSIILQVWGLGAWGFGGLVFFGLGVYNHPPGLLIGPSSAPASAT